MNKCEICGVKSLNKLRKGKCDKCYKRSLENQRLLIKYGNNSKVWIPFNEDSF